MNVGRYNQKWAFRALQVGMRHSSRGNKGFLSCNRFRREPREGARGQGAPVGLAVHQRGTNQRKLALRLEPPPPQALARLVKKARTTTEGLLWPLVVPKTAILVFKNFGPPPKGVGFPQDGRFGAQKAPNGGEEQTAQSWRHLRSFLNCLGYNLKPFWFSVAALLGYR